MSIVYDTTAPPAPVGLTGVSPTADKPCLTWTAAAPDVLSGLDHYDVYRGTTLVGSCRRDDGLPGQRHARAGT